jgi:hypothetical protein
VGSSTESDTDGESPDMERLNRRIRREQRKAERSEIIDETILDRSDSPDPSRAMMMWKTVRSGSGGSTQKPEIVPIVVKIKMYLLCCRKY